MATEIERLTAAQAKADELVAAIAEAPEPGRHLRVAITDPETEQRLATCFVNYETAEEHEELSRKVAEANRRSESRPK